MNQLSIMGFIDINGGSAVQRTAPHAPRPAPHTSHLTPAPPWLPGQVGMHSSPGPYAAAEHVRVRAPVPASLTPWVP